MVNGKQEPSHACGKGEAKEEDSPFFGQLSGEQSEQDLGSCANRNETEDDVDECEDIQDHAFTSSTGPPWLFQEPINTY
jgi:hypothetical protein